MFQTPSLGSPFYECTVVSEPGHLRLYSELVIEPHFLLEYNTAANKKYHISSSYLPNGHILTPIIESSGIQTPQGKGAGIKGEGNQTLLFHLP